MKSKNIVTIVLWLFVGASVVALAARGLRQGQHEQADAQTAAIKDGVIVYYFHGNTRCPTCRKIESYAHEAIERGFAAELDSGRLQWKVVNYETPGNEHLAEDYQVIAPSMVLVEMRGGKQKQWQNLDRVWELVMTGTKEAFVEYVQEETQTLLQDSAG
jgi:thiol-disulfide isomerase/thioredoxin